MSKNTPPSGLKKLTFEVLHPIRDFVIEHGVEEQLGHPLKYVRLKVEGEDGGELVICAHDTKEHTRLRISMGDTVPVERLAVIFFQDEPQSWMRLDVSVGAEILIAILNAIRAGTLVVDDLNT